LSAADTIDTDLSETSRLDRIDDIVHELGAECEDMLVLLHRPGAKARCGNRLDVALEAIDDEFDVFAPER
jgi:hypothetical protein